MNADFIAYSLCYCSKSTFQIPMKKALTPLQCWKRIWQVTPITCFFCTLTILAVLHFALDDKRAHMVHALGVGHLFLSNRHNRNTCGISLFKGTCNKYWKTVINTGKDTEKLCV